MALSKGVKGECWCVPKARLANEPDHDSWRRNGGDWYCGPVGGRVDKVTVEGLTWRNGTTLIC